MYTLAIDSTAVQASVCLAEGTKIIGEFYIDTKQKHSRTLMIMVENTLRCLNLSTSDIGLFAVAAGPGSFTGVRIGVSCVKGMALPCGTPCAGVSALEALAYSAKGVEGLVCPVMDARCGQVYTAQFCWKEDRLIRLSQDAVLPIEALAELLGDSHETITLCGDGADLCIAAPSFRQLSCRIPSFSKANRASFVALAGYDAFLHGKVVSADELSPVYLSMPQAQRKLINKQEE